jgi:hypothetical protein
MFQHLLTVICISLVISGGIADFFELYNNKTAGQKAPAVCIINLKYVVYENVHQLFTTDSFCFFSSIRLLKLSIATK